MSFEKLVVGLGNPGPGYEKTRHNLGFMVLRYFADQHHLSFRRSRHCRGLLASGAMAHAHCGLLMPMTFMNNSGQVVKDIMDFENIALKNLLVVCDDFHLEFGQIRIRLKGSAGGHNGLLSIINSLGTDSFSRIRMGIGSPQPGQDPAGFVLENFPQREKKELLSVIENGAECCLMWLSQEHRKAMNQFNKRKRENG